MSVGESDILMTAEEKLEDHYRYKFHGSPSNSFQDISVKMNTVNLLYC